MSPEIDELCAELAGHLNAMTDKQQRQHIIQDLLNRLDFTTIVMLPPTGFPEHHVGAVYRAMGSVLGAIMNGVSTIAIVGHKASTTAYSSVPRPDASRDSGERLIDQPDYREDVVVDPTGGTFSLSTAGPFELHLPAWCDAAMGAELGGIMWRVLRFCLAGCDDISDGLKSEATAILGKHDRARYMRQYVAMGYIRWLLTAGGIRTFDIFGNEVEDNEEYFYGWLFERPDASEEFSRHSHKLGGLMG